MRLAVLMRTPRSAMAQRFLQAGPRIDAEALQGVKRVQANLRVDVGQQGD